MLSCRGLEEASRSLLRGTSEDAHFLSRGSKVRPRLSTSNEANALPCLLFLVMDNLPITKDASKMCACKEWNEFHIHVLSFALVSARNATYPFRYSSTCTWYRLNNYTQQAQRHADHFEGRSVMILPKAKNLDQTAPDPLVRRLASHPTCRLWLPTHTPPPQEPLPPLNGQVNSNAHRITSGTSFGGHSGTKSLNLLLFLNPKSGSWVHC